MISEIPTKRVERVAEELTLDAALFKVPIPQCLRSFVQERNLENDLFEIIDLE